MRISLLLVLLAVVLATLVESKSLHGSKALARRNKLGAQNGLHLAKMMQKRKEEGKDEKEEEADKPKGSGEEKKDEETKPENKGEGEKKAEDGQAAGNSEDNKKPEDKGKESEKKVEGGQKEEKPEKKRSEALKSKLKSMKAKRGSEGRPAHSLNKRGTKKPAQKRQANKMAKRYYDCEYDYFDADDVIEALSYWVSEQAIDYYTEETVNYELGEWFDEYYYNGYEESLCTLVENTIQSVGEELDLEADFEEWWYNWQRWHLNEYESDNYYYYDYSDDYYYWEEDDCRELADWEMELDSLFNSLDLDSSVLKTSAMKQLQDEYYDIYEGDWYDWYDDPSYIICKQDFTRILGEAMMAAVYE